MRAIEDIISNEKITSMELLAQGSTGCAYDGTIFNGKRTMFFVMASNEGGWEHVSVSFCNNLLRKRGELPSWNEMAMVKDIFWDEEEEVYQIHPPRSEYVNIEEVLHLWKPRSGLRLESIVRMEKYNHDW